MLEAGVHVSVEQKMKRFPFRNSFSDHQTRQREPGSMLLDSDRSSQGIFFLSFDSGWRLNQPDHAFMNNIYCIVYIERVDDTCLYRVLYVMPYSILHSTYGLTRRTQMSCRKRFLYVLKQSNVRMNIIASHLQYLRSNSIALWTLPFRSGFCGHQTRHRGQGPKLQVGVHASDELMLQPFLFRSGFSGHQTRRREPGIHGTCPMVFHVYFV